MKHLRSRELIYKQRRRTGQVFRTKETQQMVIGAWPSNRQTIETRELKQAGPRRDVDARDGPALGQRSMHRGSHKNRV